MILGFHLTWTTYGHWFPNDPRGSWSNEVWNPLLSHVRILDVEHQVTEPRSVPVRQMRQFVEDAAKVLKSRPVLLSNDEIALVAECFHEILSTTNTLCYGCAILPNHVHLLVGRPECTYERLVNRLKGRSAQRIRECRHLAVVQKQNERVPVWTSGYWVRYVDTETQFGITAEYIKKNAPDQAWSFVVGL